MHHGGVAVSLMRSTHVEVVALLATSTLAATKNLNIFSFSFFFFFFFSFRLKRRPFTTPELSKIKRGSFYFGGGWNEQACFKKKKKKKETTVKSDTFSFYSGLSFSSSPLSVW
eukprot:TRINITY_DN2493_c0_g1_i1.p1 TRINITY_DN2493_c0_g1~~TRINITY_DN2493_c0_g1_i1.p1  ORF type:complete len:113 (+),score=11.50 TRINITY_DN2493_c0_g1_i1:64-402(+)